MSCCHSIHLSIGCHTAYYCFRHDKTHTITQWCRFSIYSFFLILFFIMIISIKDTQTTVSLKKKYSYLLNIILINNIQSVECRSHRISIIFIFSIFFLNRQRFGKKYFPFNLDICIVLFQFSIIDWSKSSMFKCKILRSNYC